MSLQRFDSHLWWRDAACYQLHVRSLMDRIGDCTGDFAEVKGMSYLWKVSVVEGCLSRTCPSLQCDPSCDAVVLQRSQLAAGRRRPGRVRPASDGCTAARCGPWRGARTRTELLHQRKSSTLPNLPLCALTLPFASAAFCRPVAAREGHQQKCADKIPHSPAALCSSWSQVQLPATTWETVATRS